MLLLNIFALFVFAILLYGSVNDFRKIRDNDLGYEEIILFTNIISSILNIVISVSFMIYRESDTFAHILFGSQIFQSLLIFSTMKYIEKAHAHRLESKRNQDGFSGIE